MSKAPSSILRKNDWDTKFIYKSNFIFTGSHFHLVVCKSYINNEQKIYIFPL